MNIVDHLISRDLDFATHHVWINHAECVAVFPLWNLSGQLVGYQQYRPQAPKKTKKPSDGKYFTYTNKHSVAVWGLESFSFTPDHLFVVEGVFDATRLTKRGVSAVAVLCNDPNSSTKNWLYNLNRTITVIADDDEGGRELSKVGDRFNIVPNGDLGDASDDYVDRLVNTYTKRKQI